jgi:quercetin dioxygenase-like cupin family protein
MPSGVRAVAVGDVLESSAHDLRAVVLHSDRDLLRANVQVGPRGNGGPLHRHLRQEERFLIREGTLRVREGLRRARTVSAGEEVAIRPGLTHTFTVIGDGAHFVAEFRPAGRIAEVFRDVFASSTEGRLGRFGLPRLSDIAHLIEEYPEDFFYAPFVPVAVQRALAAVATKLT